MPLQCCLGPRSTCLGSGRNPVGHEHPGLCPGYRCRWSSSEVVERSRGAGAGQHGSGRGLQSWVGVRWRGAAGGDWRGWMELDVYAADVCVCRGGSVCVGDPCAGWWDFEEPAGWWQQEGGAGIGCYDAMEGVEEDAGSAWHAVDSPVCPDIQTG